MATTGDSLDREVLEWSKDARNSYLLDCKAMEELWQAYCGIDWEPGSDDGKNHVEATGRAIQERMQGTMKPILDRLPPLEKKVAALIAKKKTKSRGETLRENIDKEKVRLGRLVNQDTWRGNNHPLTQYARRYGDERHQAEWSSNGCKVPTSSTGYAVFPGGTHTKPDCIVPSTSPMTPTAAPR